MAAGEFAGGPQEFEAVRKEEGSAERVALVLSLSHCRGDAIARVVDIRVLEGMDDDNPMGLHTQRHSYRPRGRALGRRSARRTSRPYVRLMPMHRYREACAAAGAGGRAQPPVQQRVVGHVVVVAQAVVARAVARAAAWRGCSSFAHECSRLGRGRLRRRRAARGGCVAGAVLERVGEEDLRRGRRCAVAAA